MTQQPATPSDERLRNDLREQALREAYWAHREVPGRHGGECCQDRCFPDITDRWVHIVTERVLAR